MSLPNLVSVDPSNLQGGGISLQNCSLVSSFSAPVLQTCCQIVIVTSGLNNGSLSFPALTSMPGANVFGSFSALAVQCASLSVPVLATLGGQLELAGSGNFTFPVLTSITNSSGVVVQGALYTGTTISFPSLTTVQGNFIATNCPNLTTLNVPVWLPQAGKQIVMSTAPSLSAASVNLILSRCVANGAFSGPSSQVLLGGASPTGQGTTDKATLIGRGCTVVTN